MSGLYPARAAGPYTPPSTGWQPPNNYFSGAVATVVSGTATFLPFDVGPVAKSYSNLGVGVTTAQVAGTTTTTLGVYRDDGSGGQPLLAGGPLVSTTIVLTATGNAKGAVTWAPAPSRYWLAFLYVATVAPTTSAQVTAVTNSSPSLWLTSTLTLGTTLGRALQVTGLTALPTTAQTFATTTGSTAPAVYAQAA